MARAQGADAATLLPSGASRLRASELVRRTYREILGHEPDAAGWRLYTDRVARGLLDERGLRAELTAMKEPGTKPKAP